MLAEKSNFSIARMARCCRCRGRATTRGWIGRRLPQAVRIGSGSRRRKLTWFHGESDEVSGSPRILADLRAEGEIIQS